MLVAGICKSTRDSEPLSEETDVADTRRGICPLTAKMP